MIELLLAAQLAAQSLVLPCSVAAPNTACIELDDEGNPHVITRYVEHHDPWWFYAVSMAYGTSVLLDATTSAYGFGAKTTYEQNILYRDVQHHPFRFGLRRAGLGAVLGVAMVIVHKKVENGPLYSTVILAAATVATVGIAVRNQRVLDQLQR